MRVAHRHLNIRVAQQPRNRRCITSCVTQSRRKGVTQIVKVKIFYACVNACSHKSLFHVHQTFTRSPLSNPPRSEYEIALLSLALLYQNFSDSLTHWDDPIARSLCIDYVNYAAQKINMPPRQI